MIAGAQKGQAPLRPCERIHCRRSQRCNGEKQAHRKKISPIYLELSKNLPIFALDNRTFRL